jgi:Kef-type K+ transport system membrane component KefB
VLKAGSLLALGIMLQHAVIATFNAADLMYRDSALTLTAVRRVATYAVLHISVAAVFSTAVLALGTWLFAHLTRDVNEMDEIRRGNVAPAVVLAAVMIVLALMTAPGLQMVLDALLPLPELGRDQIEGPA